VLFDEPMKNILMNATNIFVVDENLFVSNCYFGVEVGPTEARGHRFKSSFNLTFKK
jgi:hypothetical protein